MSIAKRLLQRVKLIATLWSQPLDGLDLMAVRLHRQQQAGTHRLAVEEHRAGTADPVLAADVSPGQPEVLTQEVGEERPGLGVPLAGLPVHPHADRQVMGSTIAQAAPPARSTAVANARPVSTPTRCRVNSGVAWMVPAGSISRSEASVAAAAKSSAEGRSPSSRALAALASTGVSPTLR